MALMPGTDVAAQRVTGTLSTTKEGWTEKNLVWDTNAIARPFTMNLSVNKYWTLNSATIGVSYEPFVTDPGTQWEQVNYPERPRLDVGRSGDDWVWVGTFGRQGQFTEERDSIDLALKTNATTPAYIPLPSGAKIKNISFDVKSTQTNGYYDYSMTVGDSTKVVWHRGSIDFAKGTSIPTKDPDTNSSVNINSVCADHLDYPMDNFKDIVASGDNGLVFTAIHNPDQPSGFGPLSGAMRVSGDSPPGSILDCAIGDFNKDGMNDVALATSDGKIYILKNDGTGRLVLPAYKISPNTTRVDSVAMGDVNGDGWGDIVGGDLKGQFIISTWNPQTSSFNNPYAIMAGTGSVNGLAIQDVNFDGLNDIIGANENRHWYVLRNNGTGWEMANPVSCGGDDLDALAVADLNNDRQPDLISSSVDGSFYVTYDNVGSFYKGERIRGGSQTMKDLVAADLDRDGDMDVLGLNGDGWVYLSLNYHGFLQDAKKLIQVGADQNTLTVADLNNDQNPDLILGGKNGITVYWNTNGPFVDTLGKDDGGVLKYEVQAYLDSFKPGNEDIDEYGNVIAKVPFNIHSEYAGNLTLSNVNITYDYEREVDITAPLVLYIKANMDKADHEGYVTVPVQFLTDSVGGLHIANISIIYDINLAAIIDSPVEMSSYNYTDEVTFKGHSNLDLDCNFPGFEYNWLADGSAIGTGCNFKTTAFKALGGTGAYKVRLMVQRLSGQQIAYSDVDVTVRPPTPPRVDVNPVVDIKANKELHYKVQAKDDDPKDEANLTFALGMAPNGMTINNSTGEIYWKPGNADVGNHMVVVDVSDGKNITSATFFVKVGKAPSIVSVPVCLQWPVILTIVIVGLAFGVVFVETEVGIFALYSLAFFMYTRLKQEMVLDNFVRGQIYGHICENPGLHLAEIQRKLKISAGTLIYHLKTLEREGLVKSFPNGSLRVFFSSSVKVPKELMSLTKAQRWILKAIEERPGISQKELSESTGLSDSTVNRIVHELEERGMVRIEKGKTTQCFIVDN